MTSVAVLLRGINVGSHHRLPMKDLVPALIQRGLGHPRTYLQSGNVVFDVDRVPDAAGLRQLSAAVSQVISEEFGMDVPAVSVTDSRLTIAAQQAVRGVVDPDPKLLHVAFWDRPEGSEALRRLDAGRQELLTRAASGDFGRDRLQILQDCAILDYAGPSHESKLTLGVLEKALGVTATARNLRTVRTLAEF